MNTAYKETTTGFPSHLMNVDSGHLFLNNSAPKIRKEVTTTMSPGEGLTLARRLIAECVRAFIDRRPVSFYVAHEEAIKE